MKRIVTIQDLTCLGKCALSTALPVISAMGVEAAVLPTALLSTHTAFPHFTFHDLSSELPTIVSLWKEEGFTFDGIYTGYLGTLTQMDMVSSFIDDFKSSDTFVFLDPVLGDHGVFYAGFDENSAKTMGKLCAKADIITPNLTEACLLLGKDYPKDGVCDESYCKTLLKELSQLGAKKVVMTGASFETSQLGVMAYDRETDSYFSYFNKKLPMSFHGTGDLFSSTCVGAICRGLSFEDSLTLAVDFTLESIKCSLKDPNRRWYSVNFEEAIPMLVDRLRGTLG